MNVAKPGGFRRRIARPKRVVAVVGIALVGLLPPAVANANATPEIGTTVVTNADATREIQVQTRASGSRVCGIGTQVYVRATLLDPGAISFYKNGTAVNVDFGTDHFYSYGVRNVKWEIYAPSGIATANDGCTAMPGFVSPDPLD